jgi:hypothetical protein
MESVLITPKSKKEFQFITELLNKLGISNKKLSLQEKEDLALSLLMSEADRSKKVSEKIIMRKLKS